MVDFKKRTKSSFDISIGTGLMLESLFTPIAERYDNNRNVPFIYDNKNYKYHFINLITIVRNIIQGFDVKIDPLIILKDRNFINVLLDEMNIIYGLYTTSHIQLSFYYSDVINLSNHFNNGKDRKFTQPLLLNLEIQKYLNSINLQNILPKHVNFFPNIITLPTLPLYDKALLTSNIAMDLCSKNNIFLLDTYTGLLYGKDKFYKKYNPLGNRDMSVIPFREKLLYIIGDKNISLIFNTIFRSLLLDIAEKDKWNYLTSDFKIEQSISKASKELYKIYKEFKCLY